MASDQFNERLNRIIPGGAHTCSRGDDQFPANAPSILEKGKGCYVWDGYGNKFLDYGMALRAVTVGYSEKEINDAAIKQIENGNNLTRASIVELEAAELLCDLVPSVEMVKFAKNGSTVTTAAVKLSRAYTGRKYIAVCAEHPFFSFDDWFIGTTPVERGVPAENVALTLKFHYNDIGSLKRLFDNYPGQVAGVILEPVTTTPPENNFLHEVKDLCHRNGTVFILDEMITGFRWDIQGAQHFFNIEPDLTTFGKGMANGFSVAALAGKKELMNLGSIKEPGMERTFLISTTHGAEMCGLGAFIKTVEYYRKKNVVGHLWDYGKQLMDGINGISVSLDLKEYFYVIGYPCSPAYITCDHEGQPSAGFRTLFSQEMIKDGILMPWIALSLAHGQKELEATLNAAEKALRVYKKALTEGYEKFLSGPPIKAVFRKYN